MKATGITLIADWPQDALPQLRLDPYTAVAALARVPGARDEQVALGLAHVSPEVRRATVDALTRMKHPGASSRDGRSRLWCTALPGGISHEISAPISHCGI